MVSVRLAITDLVVVVLATTNGVVDCSCTMIGVRCTCVVCICCLPSTCFCTVTGSVLRCTLIKLCIANVGSIIVFVCLLTTYCGCETALYCSSKALAVSGTGTGRTRGTIGCTTGVATLLIVSVVDSEVVLDPTKSFMLRTGAA